MRTLGFVLGTLHVGSKVYAYALLSQPERKKEQNMSTCRGNKRNARYANEEKKGKKYLWEVRERDAMRGGAETRREREACGVQECLE